MAITDFLFPQGNFLNIRSNAPNQRSYNIDATADLARNLPGGFLKDLISPAATATLSLPYDAIQASTRTTQSDIDRAMQTGALTPRDIASEAFGLAYDRENPLSSAYERFIGASAPLAERISNISNPFKMSQAAASEVDLSNRNINTTEPYQDLIMNPDYMPNRLQNLERFADNRFEDLDFQPGFNFKDAPNKTSNLIELYQNRSYLNNPRRGIIDNLIMQRGNPGVNLMTQARDAVTTGVGKGIDFGKAAIGGILSLVTGIPGVGALLSGLQSSPQGKDMKDFYGEMYGLDDIGRIASGPMKGYAPGDTLFGGPGLTGAIDKRIDTITKTLKKKKSTVLEQRLKELEKLKEKERQRSAQQLEEQRRGRRPGSGGDGPGTKDSGGPTGGYSYDSGGRQGFGYGLKKGGLAGLL